MSRVFEREPEVVSEKIFHALEWAIVLVVGCLAFRFLSPLITRSVWFSPDLKGASLDFLHPRVPHTYW